MRQPDNLLKLTRQAVPKGAGPGPPVFATIGGCLPTSGGPLSSRPLASNQENETLFWISEINISIEDSV